MTQTQAKAFVEFSRPFIKAVKNIFITMMGTELEVGKPSLKASPGSKGDITTIIGASGRQVVDGEEKPFRGMLSISYPNQTYIQIANTMLMEEHTEFNEEIADVGSEICNMIMGNAKRDLSEQGYFCEMAIPSMVQGKGHSIKYPDKTIIISIPIASKLGNFEMEVCFESNS